jgi:tryptophan synthase alpha chain
VADGPTIQAAVVRALQRGATPVGCLEAIGEIRRQSPTIPIGILTYANVMYAGGMDARFQELRQAGVDSVLTADIPIAEASPYLTQARAAGVDPVFIAPPDIDEATLQRIASASRGYTYVVTRRGVTGCEQQSDGTSAEILRRLREAGSAPPVMGFGISTPAHVRKAIAAGAAGAISGSAVVEIVSRHACRNTSAYKELAAFVQSMKECTRIGTDTGRIEE